MAQAQPIIKQAVGINFTDASKDESTSKFKPEDGWLVGGSIMLGEKKFYLKPGSSMFKSPSIDCLGCKERSME